MTTSPNRPPTGRHVWTAVGAVALVLVVAVVLAVVVLGRSPTPSTSSHPAPTRPATVTVTAQQPSPTASPPAATSFSAPSGTLTLPGPRRTTGGVGVGYPHTTVGAISAAAHAVAAVVTLDAGTAHHAARTVAVSPDRDTVSRQVDAQVSALRKALGVAARGPAGTASAAFAPQAYQVKSSTASSVIVWILGASTGTGPATGGALRSAPVATGLRIVWSQKDWKITADQITVPAADQVTAGTAPAYAEGWHDCVLNS